MNAFLNHPAVQAIGWGLLHFVWQGTLLAALLLAANALIRKSQATLRYALSCTTLLLMPALFFLTIFRTDIPRAGVDSLNHSEHPTGARAPLDADERPILSDAGNMASHAGEPHVFRSDLLTGGAVLGWLIGVAALSLYTFVGWVRVRRLTRRGVRLVTPALAETLEQLRRRLRISRPVRLCLSAIAEVPTVIGWMRPYVLLPVSTITGLSEWELRAILAHELAHIRRCDYLVNLLQNAIETLLFYHPAVWWVSSCIRNEREHCCDDVAVSVCGDAMLYARALTQLEELRPAICEPCEPALAATGGDLLARIRRLTGARETGRDRIAGSVGAAIAAVVTFGAMIAVGNGPIIHAQPQKAPAAFAPASIPSEPAPVVIAQSAATPARTTAPRPSVTPRIRKFDVASIRPAGPYTGGPAGGVQIEGKRLIAQYVALTDLIGFAWNVREFQISGGPSWKDGGKLGGPDRYRVEAKVEGGEVPTEEEMRLMLRTLLAERFNLKVIAEKKPFPAWDMVIDKGGAKLTPSGPDAQFSLNVDMRQSPRMQLIATGVTIEQLVGQQWLRQFSGRPVVDKTELSAKYDIQMQWVRESLGVDSELAEFATAIREQLGLKLESGIEFLDAVTIEHVERPSEN